MLRFLGGRLLHALGLLLAVSLLTFALAALAPGSFTDEMRTDPRVAPETIAAMRARYGLDRPFLVRYATWLASACRGDLGFSLAYNTEVAPLLRPRIANTLILAGSATAAAWAIALPLGLWTAARRGGALERVLTIGAVALGGVPDILLTLAALLLAAESGWFPVGGMRSAADTGGSAAADLLRHLFLPAATLALGIASPVFRHARAAMIDAMSAPSVVAARARGIPTAALVVRHALKLAANPLVTLAGLSIASLLSASLLVEIVMAWPGLGPLLLDGVLSRDVPLVAGATLVASALLIAANLAADVALYRVDPRIRVAG
jgi:peptide/nickel transport system permease protein